VKYNSHEEFVGLVQLKHLHHEQILSFKYWASKNQWFIFHQNHYDWWTFPINKPSHYGFKYVVYEGDIEELKQDSRFMDDYIKGVELLSASWGWDIKYCEYLRNPDPSQKWNNWPIRLYKAGLSVQLFGFSDLFYALQSYARELIGQGESFCYNGRDLSALFV
jgi:hypothetical protein